MGSNAYKSVATPRLSILLGQDAQRYLTASYAPDDNTPYKVYNRCSMMQLGEHNTGVKSMASFEFIRCIGGWVGVFVLVAVLPPH